MIAGFLIFPLKLGNNVLCLQIYSIISLGSNCPLASSSNAANEATNGTALDVPFALIK